MPLRFWISEISLSECEPYCCPDQHFSNRESVTHWLFSGDGPNVETARHAEPSMVKEYIQHCEAQILLAKRYLSEIDGK